MKKPIVFSLITLLAAAALAQTPPQPAPPSPAPGGTPGPEAKPPDQPVAEQTTYNGAIDFGLQSVHNDTGSAKFIEYRDVPTGGVLPFFRIRTDAANYDFQLTGENTARTDQRFLFRADTPWVRVNGDYNQIPHRWGIGHTLETQTSKSSFEISDTLQAAFQSALEKQFATNKSGITFPFLLNLVSPSLATANAINLELLRKRGVIDLNILPDAPVNTHVTYFAESRSGNRAAGTSFGFSNVVETPEPINYRTTDVGASAEMPFNGGLVRGGLHVNTFRDEVSSYTFDNPFRAVSSTDASAYTAPGSGSIGGAAFGRLASPPDNRALNGALGVIYKLPLHSRVTADVNLGRWSQNQQFIPYTTNTAITTPVFGTDVSALPAQSLNGKVNTTGATLQLTSAPITNLNLSARWRYYNFDNQSPRIVFPGYVRFDAVWEPIGRINVPYSYRTSRGDLTASYDLGKGDIEAGFRSETRHHTFRAVERDTENVFRIGGDVRAIPWTMFRVSYEFGNRGINGYDPEAEENASFTTAQAASQPPTLRRFDVNARHVSRIVSTLQVTPRDGNLSFDLQYLYNLDRYKDAQFGLQRWKNNSFTAEASYAPSDRWNSYLFYSNEFLGGIQTAEQNSNGVLSLDPRNDWIANNTDRVNSVGAGLNYGIIPKKIDTHVWVRYQRTNGNAALSAVVPNSNLHPQSIPNFDDTKLWTTSAELTYHLLETVDFAVGAWIEKYNLNDAESSNLPNYVPGSFFLAPNDLDYRGTVGYVRASYHW